MSVMGLANHLMLDFRSVIVPRFLYVSSSDWDESGQPVKEIAERMDLMIDDMAEIQIKQGEA
jgi:FMN reductase